MAENAPAGDASTDATVFGGHGRPMRGSPPHPEPGDAWGSNARHGAGCCRRPVVKAAGISDGRRNLATTTLTSTDHAR